jgi:glycosyltransferase involved in cell wall biosynthesis
VADAGKAFQPLVSVVLTTRDRPRFLPLALAGYRQQTYAHRELIVVDDGERFPADETAVTAAGGRLLRLPSGTPLGAKLNTGIASARGDLIQKLDDDDWYGPPFLAAMVDTLATSWAFACQPALVFLSPFLFFDLARWDIRRSSRGHLPGAAMLFPRDLWREQPFRPLPGDEDTWFLLDQTRLGAELVTCEALTSYLVVRHAGIASERGHTWVHQGIGELLDDFTSRLVRHGQPPEALLPTWALTAYRAMRDGDQPLPHPRQP